MSYALQGYLPWPGVISSNAVGALVRILLVLASLLLILPEPQTTLLGLGAVVGVHGVVAPIGRNVLRKSTSVSGNGMPSTSRRKRNSARSRRCSSNSAPDQIVTQGTPSRAAAARTSSRRWAGHIATAYELEGIRLAGRSIDCRSHILLSFRLGQPRSTHWITVRSSGRSSNGHVPIMSRPWSLPVWPNQARSDQPSQRW
jgi:hypothetical protein